MNAEHVLFWISVILYGSSAFSYIVGIIAKSGKLLALGFYSALAGFIPHALSIGFRWIGSRTGSFPAGSESVVFGLFLTVLVFLALQFAARKGRFWGVLVMPGVFVLMGWAGRGGVQIMGASNQVGPALQSIWLWVHIIGAATGLASIVGAAGTGLLYLLAERRSGGTSGQISELDQLDGLSFRFVFGGFIMYGVMIISGSFWANQVKGSYWSGEPFEVWSLISWLAYGIYLLLRSALGWRGRKMAWYALIALVAIIISYWGVPFTLDVFHSGFFGGR